MIEIFMYIPAAIRASPNIAAMRSVERRQSTGRGDFTVELVQGNVMPLRMTAAGGAFPQGRREMPRQQ